MFQQANKYFKELEKFNGRYKTYSALNRFTDKVDIKIFTTEEEYIIEAHLKNDDRILLFKESISKTNGIDGFCMFLNYICFSYMIYLNEETQESKVEFETQEE
jgi:hypothetical protein